MMKDRLASERIVVEAPLSYLGSAKRLWGITRERNAVLRWLLLAPVALLLTGVAWIAVTAWYFVFGLLVVPYRLLIGRRRRKRKLDDARHREVLQSQ